MSFEQLIVELREIRDMIGADKPPHIAKAYLHNLIQRLEDQGITVKRS